MELSWPNLASNWIDDIRGHHFESMINDDEKLAMKMMEERTDLPELVYGRDDCGDADIRKQWEV